MKAASINEPGKIWKAEATEEALSFVCDWRNLKGK